MDNLYKEILVEQSYRTSVKSLSTIVFGQNSAFREKWAQVDKTENLVEEAWTKDESGRMKRIITYRKSNSTIPMGFKCIEEQTYFELNDKGCDVLTSVTAPDVPFGTYFVTELLYCIRAGLKLGNGEDSCSLKISWRANFVKRTIMKGMIEGKTRKELKRSYRFFEDLLSDYAKPVDGALLKPSLSEKKNFHTVLQSYTQTEGKMSFGCALLLFLASLFVHTFVDGGLIMKSFRYLGVNLPDYFGTFITGWFLISQLKRLVRLSLTLWIGATTV